MPAARRSPTRPTLNDWAADTYSQNGEDGMIAEVLRRLGIERGTCVEVGAHDGFTYSNTARLWHDNGWRATLIEPDPERVALLRTRTAGAGADCSVLPVAVGVEGASRLDHLLATAGMTGTVDLLSIDVDGSDVAILRSLADTSVRANVLICEFNPTIPWHLDLEGPPGTSVGCSASTLVAAAEAQGYALVGITHANAIFTGAEAAAAFDDLERDLAALADPSSYVYVVSDFTGRATVVGDLVFPFRSGRSPLAGAGRDDVRLRWTARGLLRNVAFRSSNAKRWFAGRSPSAWPGAVRRRVVADVRQAVGRTRR